MTTKARAALHTARSVGLADWFRPSTERARQQAIADLPGGKLIEQTGPTEAEKQAQAEAEGREQERAEREAEAGSEVGERVQEIKNLPDGVPLTGGWSGY